MIRTVALGLLALAPALARADVGVSLRSVPVHLTLTVDRDYPEFAFFLVEPERHTVRQVSPTAAEPAVVHAGDPGGSYFVVEVYVVPKSELMGFDRALPPAQWFEGTAGRQYVAGQIGARPILDVFDNRARIEKAYRVHRVGDAFRLDLVSENKGNPWVARVWAGLCCGSPAVAIAAIGIWLMRRSNQKARTQHRPPEQ